MSATTDVQRTVGVITRTKSRPILLKRALRSVLEQSYEDWRMVIINDGGDPEPVNRLVAYHAQQARGRITVIHNERSLGMEVASNRGIDSVREYIGYLVIHDDDDAWAPEFLTIAVAELDHARAMHPSVQGVITMANAIYERIEGQQAVIDRIEEYKPWLNNGLISLHTMLNDNQFAPIQFLYYASILDQIGPYREDLAVLGDWEFNIRFLRQADIMIVPQVLAFYHHRIEDRNSIYGNSIIAGRQRHDLYRQLLKNEWLRGDLASGVTSLGALVNAVQHINQRLDEAIWRLSNLQKGQVEGGRRIGLIRLWLRSGNSMLYIQKFFSSLNRYGLRQTIETVRRWAAARGGRP
jgi:glycosyltransferase involved in cell wall biosynthesis